MILLLGFKHVVPLRYHYRKNYFIIIFFYKKILQVQKTPKAPKAQKAPKAKRRNQVKAQSTNKRTKIKNALKKHLRGKNSLIRLCAFLCA